MKNYFYFILICLFFSVLLFSFLIWPKFQSLYSLNKEISQKEFKFQAQEKYFQDLKKASEELKKYQDSLLKIDLALPSNPSLPELFNFLQNSSAQCGLSFKKIGSFSISQKKELKESKVDFTVAGDYPSFKNFLSLLEKSARMIEIEKISFSSPPKKGEAYEFNLTIKVYSY